MDVSKTILIFALIIAFLAYAHLLLAPGSVKNHLVHGKSNMRNSGTKPLNSCLNDMLTNEEVIAELLNLAKEIVAAQKEGNNLGLNSEETAFYDALTKPEAVKDFYENDQLVAITKELVAALQRDKTVDWQRRDSARAKMRMTIKRLLRKYKYPPEGMDDAIDTVMLQCELWADNTDLS